MVFFKRNQKNLNLIFNGGKFIFSVSVSDGWYQSDKNVYFRFEKDYFDGFDYIEIVFLFFLIHIANDRL